MGDAGVMRDAGGAGPPAPSAAQAAPSTAQTVPSTALMAPWPPEPPQSLSDEELLRRLRALVSVSRRLESVLVAHIAEVDARRLYLREACSSMFTYCVERLRLSGSEAYLRITAARASRDHPVLLDRLRDGQLTLTAIARLAAHITPENRDAILARAVHLPVKELDELLAELSPRPDAPSLMRRLTARAARSVISPDQLAAQRVGWAIRAMPGDVESLSKQSEPPAALQADVLQTDVLQTDALQAGALQADALQAGALNTLNSAVRPSPCVASTSVASLYQTPPTRQPGAPASMHKVAGPSAAQPRALIEAIAPSRYKVQFTASAELRDKLLRLQGLMRSSVPGGDLAVVIEQAVTEKLQRLETRRFGSTLNKPRRAPAGTCDAPAMPCDAPAKACGAPAKACGAPAKNCLAPAAPADAAAKTSEAGGRSSRHIPAAVRRAVRERDGEQCRFVDVQGRRCTERRWLEFHHRHPVGFGGGHSVENIALVCRAHNGHLAEIDYGRAGPRESPGSRSSASGI